MVTSVKVDNPEDAAILVLILSELRSVERKHPNWPECNVKRSAIVMEEAGELIREANQLEEGKGSLLNLKMEAIQTAAMAIRMIKNL